MLITSRQSRRWVIPKGNPAPPALAHTAAAVEAKEEAGVTGPVCPTPLGSYRYRKTRGSGASLMIDVDVFPLSVTTELDNWKEQSQRERRWFSLTEAANAVEEDDLRELIRSFNATEFKAAARRTGRPSIMAAQTRIGTMFGWFQRLMPKTGNFFELFEAHGATINAAAGALARLVQDGDPNGEHVREINEREEDADHITREVLQTVRQTFLTPFDRSAISSLIGAMDDAVDEMQAAANAVRLYDVKSFEPEMRDMAAIVVDAARVTTEALPLLRSVGQNGTRLHELTERLVRMEGQADEIHAAGVKKSFTQNGGANTLKFVVDREIYKHLERIVDAFEDIANEIDGLVIDHS